MVQSCMKCLILRCLEDLEVGSEKKVLHSEKSIDKKKMYHLQDKQKRRL